MKSINISMTSNSMAMETPRNREICPPIAVVIAVECQVSTDHQLVTNNVTFYIHLVYFLVHDISCVKTVVVDTDVQEIF